MKLLVIDGNSILNRAFYGIKLLTTKDGHFTNGIYGFLNIYLRLKELCAPDAVAVAFDLRAPTFRHQMYGGYKAQRKGMPPELAEQLPILKELLSALGLAVVECEATKQMISSARFPPVWGERPVLPCHWRPGFLAACGRTRARPACCYKDGQACHNRV